MFTIMGMGGGSHLCPKQRLLLHIEGPRPSRETGGMGEGLSGPAEVKRRMATKEMTAFYSMTDYLFDS